MKIINVIYDSENSNKDLFCRVTYSKIVWFKRVVRTDLFRLEWHKYIECYSEVAVNCRNGNHNFDIPELMILSKDRDVHI